jgi:hypothetical protein
MMQAPSTISSLMRFITNIASFYTAFALACTRMSPCTNSMQPASMLTSECKVFLCNISPGKRSIIKPVENASKIQVNSLSRFEATACPGTVRAASCGATTQE